MKTLLLITLLISSCTHHLRERMMNMDLVKEVEGYKIFKKRKLNRYAIKDADGNYVRGMKKEKILLSEGLIGQGKRDEEIN